MALAPVLAGTQQRFFTGVGELEAARQVQVAAETGGRITAIRFASGQQVKAGEVLVQLNDAPEQASLLRLRAQLHNAETSYQRTVELVQARRPRRSSWTAPWPCAMRRWAKCARPRR